ncbi:high affinity immunoglobulin gamma Fc receptor I-like isoform X2 [Brienomyrus brachyistius]|uniref:high affinity immunoglobulin gamma Fc receptor I-like isoform X2 n=1 Tax=Brienomyrus brachyistius TaxID=42636 RepID=UPI0020B375E2|nr:high affinity immunoglobulin gamma Fc receptor I-like isoform X2 [Brienomyrus brachyistius]
MFYSISLGLAVLLQHGRPQDTPRPRLTVEPPGPAVYVGEVVSLRCQLEGSITAGWTYTWYPPASRTTMTPIPGHRSNGSWYAIFGVLPSDQGTYRCQAERIGPPPISVLSNSVTLTVMDLPPGTLTVSPDSRRHFRGDRLSLHCRFSCSNTTAWTLKHLNEQARVETGCCPGGSMSKWGQQTCDFPSLNSWNAGLYWCESGGQRTNAIDITVDESPVIIQGPTQSVLHGGNVTLHCCYRGVSPRNITFYKDGMEIETRGDGKMTMRGVTKEDEGFYSCSGKGTGTISAETWVSVTGSSTAEEIISQQPNLHSKGIITSTTENTSPSPEQIGKSLSEELALSGSLAGPPLWMVMICIVIFLMLIPALGILAYRCSHLEFPPSSRCSIADSESQYAGQNSPQPNEDPWSMTWVEMMTPLNNQDHHGSQEETEPQMDDPEASQA